MDYKFVSQLTIRNVHKATILPYKKSQQLRWGEGGVVDEHGEFVAESSNGICENGVWSHASFGAAYTYEEDELVTFDETVIFIGHLIDHWGSFLFDQLSRLWYLEDYPNSYRLCFCGIDFKEGTFGLANKNCFEVFEVLGIPKERLLDIRRPSKFGNVIVPQLSFVPGVYFSDRYLKLYELLRDRVQKLDIQTFEKIYFTRTQFSKQKEVGEDSIELFFQRNGFKVLAPEQLSFKEQLFLIKHCTILASIEGTVAHNVLFASSTLKEQIIIRKQSEENPRQELYNQLKGIRTTILNLYAEPFRGFPRSHDDGPFLLRMNRSLLHFAQDRGMEWRSDGLIIKRFSNDVIYSGKCLKCLIKPNLKRLIRCTKKFLSR